MNTPKDVGKGWIEQPKHITRIVYGLYIACALVALLDFVIDRQEYFHFAAWPGFYAWYGFLACVGLVLAAKGLRRLVMRSEHYYNDTPPRQPPAEDER